MARQTVVHKGRYAIKRVNLNEDLTGTVEADFIAQIRETPDRSSALIAEWDVSYDTVAADGVLRLEMSATVTGLITQSSGFMDVMRTDGGQKVSCFDEALYVEFRGMPSDEP